MWQLVGIDLLGSRAGDMGESGWGLNMLGEGGVFVMSCNGCVVRFVSCVVFLLEVKGSRGDWIWLFDIVCLCVKLLFG